MVRREGIWIIEDFLNLKFQLLFHQQLLPYDGRWVRLISLSYTVNAIYDSRCHFLQQSMPYTVKIMRKALNEVVGVVVVYIGLECQLSWVRNTVTLYFFM